MKKLKFTALITAAAISSGLLIPNLAFAEETEVLPDESTESIYYSDIYDGYNEDLEIPTEAPTEEKEDDSLIEMDEYNVYEYIKIKRSIMNDEKKYTRSQLKTLIRYLINQKANSVIKRYVYYDTQGYGLDNYNDPGALGPDGAYPGTFYQFKPAILKRPGYIHTGWKYNGGIYTSTSKIQMPEYDIYLVPEWVKSINITFDCGDIDDYVGVKNYTYTVTEGVSYFLPGSDKLSRKGYTISGWVSSIDNETYNLNDEITIPSDDITFTAIWTPATYAITMFASNGNSRDKYDLPAVYGEDFILPECTFEKEGYNFSCWKYNNEKYQPGDAFTVPAIISGEKIIISAVWEKSS